MIVEQVERRVLAGIELVDATTSRRVEQPLTVRATGCRIVRNLSGIYVLSTAPGFEAYTSSFREAPATPASSVTLEVSDPSGRYLPRRLAVAVPRDPDPTHASATTSLFRPVVARLYPSPIGETAVGVAVLRLSVKRGSVGARHAFVRVVRTSDSAVLARGLADERGEAMVPIPGIPVMTWGATGDAVMASETDATVTAYHDLDAATPVDPDDLEARRGALPSISVAVKLASRREDKATLEIPA